MEKAIKTKIAVVAIDVLMNRGLPAMVKILNSLNNKDRITGEDIDTLQGEMDSADYFEDT